MYPVSSVQSISGAIQRLNGEILFTAVFQLKRKRRMKKLETHFVNPNEIIVLRNDREWLLPLQRVHLMKKYTII